MTDERAHGVREGWHDLLAQLRSKRTQSLAVLTIVALIGILVLRNRLADVDDLMHGNTDQIAKLEQVTSARLQALDGQVAELREWRGRQQGIVPGRSISPVATAPDGKPSTPEGVAAAQDEPGDRTLRQGDNPHLPQAEMPRAEVAFAQIARTGLSERPRLRSTRQKVRARREARAVLIRPRVGKGKRRIRWTR